LFLPLNIENQQISKQKGEPDKLARPEIERSKGEAQREKSSGAKIVDILKDELRSSQRQLPAQIQGEPELPQPKEEKEANSEEDRSDGQRKSGEDLKKSGSKKTPVDEDKRTDKLDKKSAEEHTEGSISKEISPPKAEETRHEPAKSSVHGSLPRPPKRKGMRILLLRTFFCFCFCFVANYVLCKHRTASTHGNEVPTLCRNKRTCRR